MTHAHAHQLYIGTFFFLSNKRMKKELTEKEAFNKAATYCSRSEHCPSEVREKLYQWGIKDEEPQQRIIQQLMDEKYLDEGRFCRAFVHDKFHFNHWGRQKIAMYLSQKRLPAPLIQEALEDISDDDSLQEAQALLANKLKSIKADSSYELYAKLMRFASARGIEADIAHQAIKQLTEEYATGDEEALFTTDE